METMELALEKRTLKGKQVNRLRRQGLVPGVVYGHHFAPVAVQVPAKGSGFGFFQHLLATHLTF